MATRILPEIIDQLRQRVFAQPLEIGLFALGAFVTDVVLLVKPALECARDTFVVDLPDELGFMESDEEKLRWILLRLLGGRALRKRPGTVMLAVKPERSADNQNLSRVLLEITDTDAFGDVESVGDVAEVCHLLGGDLSTRRDFSRLHYVVSLPIVY